MFSERLEKLIQASLQDGVLTEQEKAAIIKRAQAEGEDIDEVDIYIQSLEQKRMKELKEKETLRQEEFQKQKKEKIGKTCPMCGAQVLPLTLKCECGYEFTNQKSSAQALFEKIYEIQQQPLPRHMNTDDGVEFRNKQIRDLITFFAVPNTREDILEFLSLSLPHSQKKGGLWGTKSGRILILTIVSIILSLGIVIYHLINPFEDEEEFWLCVFCAFTTPIFYGGMIIIDTKNPTFEHNDMANTWRSKFDQVLMKGRSLKGDSDFTKQLDYYEKMINK